MQGSMENQNKTILEHIKLSYANRKEPAELFKGFSVPSEIDLAYKRASINIPKFSFYYLCIGAVFTIFYLLSNVLALLPITLSVIAYYVSVSDLKVADLELTPRICLSFCVIANLVLALVFTKIALCYFSFIVFSAICLLLILGHASAIENTSEANVDDI